MSRTKIERSKHIRIQEFDGVAVGAGESVSATIPIAGLLRGRFRAKLGTAGGTFAFAFVRPANPHNTYPQDGSSLHATGNPTDLTPSGTSEDIREIDFHGESFLHVEYTDDGDGSVIDYAVFSGL